MKEELTDYERGAYDERKRILSRVESLVTLGGGNVVGGMYNTGERPRGPMVEEFIYINKIGVIKAINNDINTY